MLLMLLVLIGVGIAGLARQLRLAVSKFGEIWMLDALSRRRSVSELVPKGPGQQIDAVRRSMRYEMANTDAPLRRKVEAHVRQCSAPGYEIGQRLPWWRAQYLVNAIDLIQLIGTGKQGVERNDLEEDAPGGPHIHFGTVVAIGQETLRRAIPAGCYVFGVGLLIVYASTGTKVCQLDTSSALIEQQIFWLQIAMEDPTRMAMVQRPVQLMHVGLDKLA